MLCTNTDSIKKIDGSVHHGEALRKFLLSVQHLPANASEPFDMAYNIRVRYGDEGLVYDSTRIARASAQVLTFLLSVCMYPWLINSDMYHA